MKYSYPAEKFSVARSSLMLPHPRGEAASISNAFHECSLGLHELDRQDLDDSAAQWLRQLDDLMNTDGLDDPHGKGTWMIKAEQLDEDQKVELSRIIDELAHWFDSENT